LNKGVLRAGTARLQTRIFFGYSVGGRRTGRQQAGISSGLSPCGHTAASLGTEVLSSGVPYGKNILCTGSQAQRQAAQEECKQRGDETARIKEVKHSPPVFGRLTTEWVCLYNV